jgi:hypothetical protein
MILLSGIYTEYKMMYLSQEKGKINAGHPSLINVNLGE